MDAIGYLETTGLPSAIVAADKMLKTAAIGLIGLENTKGGGWITVGIHGDVAAVSVAIETGRLMVGDAYVGSTVLANPSMGVADRQPKLMFTEETNPTVVETTPTESQTDNSAPVEVFKPTPSKTTSEKQTSQAVTQPKKAKVTCNLCGDPDCPRKLGEPRKKCIHYSELFGKK
ncbi:BMC domain-containing protein [Levilactobacillus yiduensis]|uniref:BMC domain-containing protein n=1 Tax=Levilactobacillus yiduensis TaxID=2953880 RepID=UPI000EF2AC0C|nr:BMC domain-containing protein [Levilactobacillus yiduensis]AYM02402.1 BMC domain-containing protein [Levilactobacillus brevis]